MKKKCFLDQVIVYAIMESGGTGRISDKKGNISKNKSIDNYSEISYQYPFLTK